VRRTRGIGLQSVNSSGIGYRLVEPRTTAFTLLELIIVLAVMVGLLAVVWPNLQKPLQRTSLDEAAQLVRDAIDESRYQAALKGSPYFVQLQQGASRMRSGSLDSFLANAEEGDLSLAADETAANMPDDESASESVALSNSSNSSWRLWRLPGTVIVSRVAWTLDGSLQREAEEERSSQDSPSTERALTDDLARQEVETTAGTGRVWWLPLTATGKGRDATIELHDPAIDQRLWISYSAATGALEISR